MTLTEVVRTHCARAGVRFKHPETEGYIFIDDNGNLWRITKGHLFHVVLQLTDLMRNDWEIVR